MGFTSEERNRLINAYTEATNKRNEISERIYEAEEGLQAELESEFERLQQKVLDIVSEYSEAVPVYSVSRCPYTNEIVNHSIDIYGIDGMWWNFEAPARPEEKLPKSFFAFTGALKLSASLEHFPFLCVPGPELPFVIPRLLSEPEILAVISTIPVGNHQAFMISYYSNPMVYHIERVNDWGTDSYTYENVEGESFWDSNEVYKSECDFNLAEWIRAGKLLWIAPGDSSLQLQQSVEGCPYLNIQGRQETSYISKGEVWW